jgi:hypothetical protein
MNKLITLIIFIALLTGCAGLTELTVIYPAKILYGIDFTPFTEKEFLITPEKYSGQYESIGLIDYTTKPGAIYKITGKKLNPYYVPGGAAEKLIVKYEWKADSILFSDALNEVYKICTDMGADAIMNFKNELVFDRYDNIKNPVTITGYRITGFAIKRENK